MVNIRKVTVVIIVVTVDIRKVFSIINIMAIIIKVMVCHHGIYGEMECFHCYYNRFEHHHFHDVMPYQSELP